LNNIISIINNWNVSNNLSHIKLNLINFTIFKSISPKTVLFLRLIISCLDSLICSFNQCGTIQTAFNRNELCEVSLLHRNLLNNSLLSVFLSKLKRSYMEYFLLDIYKNTKSMWLKSLWITWNMHSPVLISFKLTCFNIQLFYILCFWQIAISRKQFWKEFKRLIFLSIMLNYWIAIN